MKVILDKTGRVVDGVNHGRKVTTDGEYFYKTFDKDYCRRDNFIKAYEEGNQHFQLSSVSREACSNCFSTLPPQFILNVKKMDKLFDIKWYGSFYKSKKN